MSFTTIVLSFALIAYLIGSIPTGYLICRYCFKIDITQHGSGNIGATNVARVLGKGLKYFVLVFLIDALKAFLLLYAANYIFVSVLFMDPAQAQNYNLVLACVVLLGNAHSIFLKFKGGKGVATSLGLITYLIPLSLVFLFIAIWLVIILLTHQAFMASLGSVVVVTIIYWLNYYTGHDLLLYFLLVICYWLILRHRTNIMLYLKRGL